MEKIKGISYGYMAKRGDYRSPQGTQSQELMYELGNNWICLPVVNNQRDINSTDIYDNYHNPSDRDLTAVIERAHSKNVKVCLKPMLNSGDYHWRAHIGSGWRQDNKIDPTWDLWFKNYTAFMLYYAEFAEETGCEMLCIGCEMLGTEHRTNDWTTLIRRLRSCFSGKLIYNTNHDEEEGSCWFDLLDYIGTSAYYAVGVNGNDKAEMVKEWEKVRHRLNDLSDRKGKQYVFMEIGCRSAHGCAVMPWDFEQTNLPYDEQEQADFYESCLDVFMDDPHFAGVFWWDWPTFTYDTAEEAKTDAGFNIHLKKAEEVLKNWYFRS